MYNNIPQELKELAQWVVWRFEYRDGDKPTKVPYSPHMISEKAKVTDPSTWASFGLACDAVANNVDINGIGFVLTANDPYTLIDLDDTNGDQALFQFQYQVCQRLDSYTELSPSGKGVHVIVKGALPAGRKRKKVEMYSAGRYMTMTGNHLPNTPTIINERHAMINELFEKLCSGKENVRFYDGNEPQKIEDKEVIDRAASAINGEKFMRLHCGDWESDYPSQSEADLSYINMLAFYTQNREQITRIFKMSPLGARNKQTSIRGVSYIDYMINKSFDRMLPPIDISALTARLVESIREEKERRESAAIAQNIPMPSDEKETRIIGNVTMEQAYPEMPPCDLPLPEGLTGEIAQYIYASAPRPVPEIAIAGALAFMCAITGRAFNVSSDGLNQYIMLLAPSGRGKEAMASGISTLVSAIKDNLPKAEEFIGPSSIMSSQALTKYMNKGQKSFLSIIGEVGIYLQTLCSDRAPEHQKSLKKMLLDIYGKSGAHKALQPMIYSDSAKNTNAILSPALTILGESTLSEFYAALDERMIDSGLLPRFTVIEYNGPRVPLNKNIGNVKPSERLLIKLHDLMAQCVMLNSKDNVINVHQDNEARAILDQFNIECDARINAKTDETNSQLWSRAYMQALKTAAVIAVGCNPYETIITKSNALWAIKLVKNSINTLLSKFESGEVGNNSDEVKQINDLKNAISRYVLAPYSELQKYRISAAMHNEKVIPYSYLQRVLVSRACFKNSRNMKPSDVIRNTLRTLCERGDIAECPRNQLFEKFGFRGNAYVIVVPAEFGF